MVGHLLRQRALRKVASGLRSVWPRTLWPRLLILMLAATGPLLALLLIGAFEDGRLVLENGRDQAVQLARLGAEQQADVLQEAVGLLQVLARVADVRQAGPRCGGLLRSVVSDHPRIEGIAVAGADGIILCGSRPGGAGINVSDRPYFIEAMQPHSAGKYALSSLTISRASGQPAMFVAVPMPPVAGEAHAGVLLASLGLDWFARLRTHAPGLADQAYLVMDSRDGALLARFPDGADRIGKRSPEHPLMQAVARSPRGGSVLAPDFDGVPRMFGFAPLPGRDAGPFLAVGLAETELRAQADRRFWLGVSLALVALGVAIAAAWLVAQRALLHPIRALAAAATALGAGDLSARAAIGRSAVQELRSLGATFTRMGRRLRDRDTELDRMRAQLEDANRRLRILVRQDGLTGLANRRRFDEALGDEYRRASRGQHPLALFMVDVDQFKPFNDTYGHPAGDSCLRALAGVLGSVLRRSGDLAARYGGEEFVILMAETDAAGAVAVAERLCMAVRGLGIPHRHGLGGIVTVSVGVAVVQPSPDHAGPAGLVEAADAALYAAKAEGRDRVCLSHGVAPAL